MIKFSSCVESAPGAYNFHSELQQETKNTGCVLRNQNPKHSSGYYITTTDKLLELIKAWDRNMQQATSRHSQPLILTEEHPN